MKMLSVWGNVARIRALTTRACVCAHEAPTDART
jgi:hypothetical protein